MGCTQYLPQMCTLKTVVIIFSILGLSSVTGKLQIYSIDSPIEVLLGHDTTIPCHFSGYEASHLDRSMVSVRWDRKTLEGIKLVYLLDAGRLTQNRPGSYIPEQRLVEGDASLYIHNTQFNDDGEYICSVFITPEKAVSTVTVQVSARPTCTLSDSRLEMNPATERSITCYVDGFYPDDVKIQWVKYSKDSSIKSNLDRQTCNSVPTHNPDETYNITSVVTVKPMNLDEDGDVYSCVISHRTLKNGLILDVTLLVKPTEVYSTSAIVGIIVDSILIWIFCFLALLFCIYKCITVPPEVPGFTIIYPIHMEENTLKCYISGFRPKNLTIKLYLESSKQNKTQVDSWSSENPRQRSQESDPEQPTTPLQNRNYSTDLRLDPVIKSYKRFFFNCTCNIHITPNFHIHNGAVLTLEVHHAALKSPICRSQILKVKAKPKLDPIETNRDSYRVGNLMKLKCKIHSFSPKTIQVLWYKDTEKISSQNMEGEDDGSGFCSVISSVQRTVEEEDFEKILRCIVKQRGVTSEPVQWKLKKIAEPILDPIQTKQESYSVGDRLELKCKIHSFLPQKIDVKWYKDEMEEIPSNTSEHKDDATKDFYVLGCMSYTIKEEDFGKIFTCEVAHQDKKYRLKWTLEKNRKLKSM